MTTEGYGGSGTTGCSYFPAIVSFELAIWLDSRRGIEIRLISLSKAMNLFGWMDHPSTKPCFKKKTSHISCLFDGLSKPNEIRKMRSGMEQAAMAHSKMGTNGMLLAWAEVLRAIGPETQCRRPLLSSDRYSSTTCTLSNLSPTRLRIVVADASPKSKTARDNNRFQNEATRSSR
jgi:hypothetical protein